MKRLNLSSARKGIERGFTMIELIVVIVIVGILAATAIPRFVDMRSDATLAAVTGVAGAGASAMALNYGGCILTNNVVTANKCVAITHCYQVSSLLQGGLPTGYSATYVSTGYDLGTTDGTTQTCLMTGGSPSQTVSFTGISAGN